MFIDLITAATFLLILVAVYFFTAPLRRKKPVKAVAPSRSFWAGPTAKLFARVVPQLKSEVDGIARDLRRAGDYSPHGITEYLATRNIVLMLIATAASVGVITLGDVPNMTLTICLIAGGMAIICYAAPRLYLGAAANSRILRLERGLPDALDMVTMCVSGGLPLPDAFQRVGTELRTAHPDVAAEFDIIRRQSDAGTVGHALRQFAERADTTEFRSLAALVSQTERMGTNVARAIKDYTEGVRRGQRQRVEERATKTTIRLLFPVIFCLAPPVYLLLCGPAVLQIREFINRENQPGGALSPATAAANRPPAINQPAAAQTEPVNF